MTTLTEPMVVSAGMLKVTGSVLLQGPGVVAPGVQTLISPKLCGEKTQLRMSLFSTLPPSPP